MLWVSGDSNPNGLAFLLVFTIVIGLTNQGPRLLSEKDFLQQPPYVPPFLLPHPRPVPPPFSLGKIFKVQMRASTKVL